jgi:hypothetical protein
MEQRTKDLPGCNIEQAVISLGLHRLTCLHRHCGPDTASVRWPLNLSLLPQPLHPEGEVLTTQKQTYPVSAMRWFSLDFNASVCCSMKRWSFAPFHAVRYSHCSAKLTEEPEGNMAGFGKAKNQLDATHIKFIQCLMFVPCTARRSINKQHYALNYITSLFNIQAPTCFGSSLQSSGSFLDPCELLEM